MTEPYALHGDVAVITLDNPPVNGLGHALRTAIVDGIDAAQSDARVKAIVLIGADKLFSGGADIREFNTPKALAEPTLHSLIRTAEGSSKPVIAAIGGTCMGGGLELALGCHYRVALPDAQMALPEVKLGLLPGAGGTQRLPRVVGVETALNMIVSGASVPASKLAKTALFDEIVSGDLLEGALAFARKVADKRPLPRVRDRKAVEPEAEAFFQFARNTVGAMAKNYPAPLKCIDAVEAAVQKPFDEGLKYERELFVELIQTPESRALRHAFFGERAAAKIPDVPADTALRKIETVGGDRRRHHGRRHRDELPQRSAAGHASSRRSRRRSTAASPRSARTTRRSVKGPATAEQLDQRLSSLKPTLAYDDLENADLVIEAVFEDMGVKEAVFRKLDEVDEAGRHPRHQHLDTRREQDRRLHEAPRATWSACTSSARRT